MQPRETHGDPSPLKNRIILSQERTGLGEDLKESTANALSMDKGKDSSVDTVHDLEQRLEFLEEKKRGLSKS